MKFNKFNKMNHKGLYTLSGIMIGLLLFMSAVMAAGYLMQDINDNYNTGLNTSFMDKYDKIDEMQGTTGSIKGQVEGSQVDSTSGEWASKGILSAIKMPLVTIDMMGEFAEDLVVRFHFDHWVYGVIIGILTIIVLFVIIGLLTKVES